MKLQFFITNYPVSHTIESIVERCGPEIKRCFPQLRRPQFQLHIQKLFSIFCDGALAGYFWDHKPSGKFKAYGDQEACIVIFPEFRSRGIGSLTLDFFRGQSLKRFFVVSLKNKISIRLFEGCRYFKKIEETATYSVFETAFDKQIRSPKRT